jgi:hypothetical protein
MPYQTNVNRPVHILDGNTIEWVHYTLSDERFVYMDKTGEWHFFDISSPILSGDNGRSHTYHLTTRNLRI